MADHQIKQKLAKASLLNIEKIMTCSNLVIFTVVDDLSIFESQIQQSLPSGFLDFYHAVLKPKGEIAIKSWLQHQVYLSLGFILSPSATQAIDSTAMEGIENDCFD